MKDDRVRRLSKLHQLIFRATGGRVGKRLVDNDMLLLTTIGRETGEEHTVPLLYLRDGERLVVIASYGGRPRHPDWYLNLRSDPTVKVRTSDEEWVGLATSASPEERDEWWDRAVEAYEGYASYQSKTARKIPIVFLERTELPRK